MPLKKASCSPQNFLPPKKRWRFDDSSYHDDQYHFKWALVHFIPLQMTLGLVRWILCGGATKLYADYLHNLLKRQRTNL